MQYLNKDTPNSWCYLILPNLDPLHKGFDCPNSPHNNVLSIRGWGGYGTQKMEFIGFPDSRINGFW